jgi:hypothetical protein
MAKPQGSEFLKGLLMPGAHLDWTLAKAATCSRATVQCHFLRQCDLYNLNLTLGHNVSIQLILVTTMWYMYGTKPDTVDPNPIQYF